MGACRKFSGAFTLAEVLITLGIIGVVAALTMPSLIQNYKKRVHATRAKQAYSILSQVIKLSEVENGDSQYWMSEFPDKGLQNTELYLKKFILPYLKGVEYCGSGLGDELKKKCGATVSAVGQTYLIANGISVAMVPSASITTAGLNENILHINIDVNGPKGPNELGVDRFFFQVKPNKGLIPYGGDGNFTKEDILKGSEYNEKPFACKQDKDTDYYRHGCPLLLMMNGWEFKDDYPLKF